MPSQSTAKVKLKNGAKMGVKGVGINGKKVSKKELKLQMKSFKAKNAKPKGKGKKSGLKMQTIKKGKRLKDIATS